MKIVLSGGTGFLGAALLKRLLAAGHGVVLLSRNPEAFQERLKERIEQTHTGSLKMERWDAKTVGPWLESLEGAEAVINLAGEPIVNRRWTPVQKELLLASRVEATRTLVAAIRRLQKKPAALLNASAVGYYGDLPEGSVTESHPKGTDFLADLCGQWEQEACVAETLGVRVVIGRIGIVLEKNGGALAKILPPFKMFAGGPLGSGRQWFPWIHREYILGAILFALEHPNLSGPVNLTAPEPVRMAEFCKTLGRILNRPSWLPVPAFALRLLLGEMSTLLLTGQQAIPKKLQDAGYPFRYAKLDDALSAILRPR